MTSFFLFMGFFLFHGVALTSAIDVSEMSIDEYIKFVNPPPVYKYQNKLGQIILCVKFRDQISVKYSQDNLTRNLKRAPKLRSHRINISNSDSCCANISLVRGSKSKCPDNTVATREIKRKDVERAGSVRQFLNRKRRRGNHIRYNMDPDDDGCYREHSLVRFDSPDEPIFRASARLNIWRPEVTQDAEFTLSQIWVVNHIFNQRHSTESVEVGWMVNEKDYGTAEPMLFVYYTADGYLNGCYDLECPGFVAADGTDIRPGVTQLGPVSDIGGAQHEISLMLDLRRTRHAGLVWALFFNDENIGHWPASLFVRLGHGASQFDAGGEVCHNSRPMGPMTKTQMGSGRFAAEEDGFAAYARAIQLFNHSRAEFDPEYRVIVKKPRCYTALYVPRSDPAWGKNIFFGGPGGADHNPECVA
eukprot:PITA_11356